MSNHRSTRDAARPLRKGDRLPSVRLREVAGGGGVAVRPSRGPRVLVTLHRADCEECVGYVKEIAATREPLESWGADLLVISPEPLPVGDAGLTGLTRLGVPVLEDPGHVVADGRLTVIIADEWGEVYFASEPEGSGSEASGSKAGHGLIAPDEVVEWVKFVAIQCPECEGPEGEWRNL